jgi:hypothetical protein
MAVMRIQVTLFRQGLLPEDNVINVMHFKSGEGTGITLSDAQAVADGVATAYEGSTLPFSNRLTGNGLVEAFSLHDTPPRQAITSSDITGMAAGFSPIPCEIAVVGSFQATPISGVAQARRRGRLYFGPLTTDAFDVTGGVADVRVTAVVVGRVRDMLNSLTPHTGTLVDPWRLAVYSPTRDAEGASVNDATVIATESFCDNAFDIQRRRGADATFRETGALV